MVLVPLGELREPAFVGGFDLAQGAVRASRTTAMQATCSQPLAESSVFSKDWASRRLRMSRLWATSTFQAWGMGMKVPLAPAVVHHPNLDLVLQAQFGGGCCGHASVDEHHLEAPGLPVSGHLVQ